MMFPWMRGIEKYGDWQSAARADPSLGANAGWTMAAMYRV
jgi:hypothetical protein